MQANNAKINDITNAEFYVGKAEEVLPEYYREYQESHGGETAHADVIVSGSATRKAAMESLLTDHCRNAAGKELSMSAATVQHWQEMLRFLRENGYELKKVCAS